MVVDSASSDFAKPEIRNIDLIARIDEYVARFQIAVHYALGVRGIERRRELPGDVHEPFRRDAPAFLDDLVEIFAFHEHHGDELDATDIAQIVNPQNVAMRDAAGQLQFLLKPQHRVGIAGQLTAHQLERNGAIEFVVPGLINLSHAAFADQRFDGVARPERGAGAHRFCQHGGGLRHTRIRRCVSADVR